MEYFNYKNMSQTQINFSQIKFKLFVLLQTATIFSYPSRQFDVNPFETLFQQAKSNNIQNNNNAFDQKQTPRRVTSSPTGSCQSVPDLIKKAAYFY